MEKHQGMHLVDARDGDMEELKETIQCYEPYYMVCKTAEGERDPTPQIEACKMQDGMGNMFIWDTGESPAFTISKLQLPTGWKRTTGFVTNDEKLANKLREPGMDNNVITENSRNIVSTRFDDAMTSLCRSKDAVGSNGKPKQVVARR